MIERVNERMNGRITLFSSHIQVRNLYSCVKIAEDFVSPEVSRLGTTFEI